MCGTVDTDQGLRSGLGEIINGTTYMFLRELETL